MCDLSVVATKNTKQESQGSLADKTKLHLPLLFFFFLSEYQLLGRQWLLVILTVSIRESTAFCESLGKKLQHNSQQFEQLAVLVTVIRCLMPTLIFYPEAVLMGSWGASGVVTPSLSHLWQERSICRHQCPEEIHQQAPSTSLRAPSHAANARGLQLLVKVICLSREKKKICTSVGFKTWRSKGWTSWIFGFGSFVCLF